MASVDDLVAAVRIQAAKNLSCNNKLLQGGRRGLYNLWALQITTVRNYGIDLRKVVTVLHVYCSTVALHPPVLSTSVW